jgi:hypothetical protein
MGERHGPGHEMRALRKEAHPHPDPPPRGRKELMCVWCDKVDPMQTEVAKWADGPLATPLTLPSTSP